MKKFEKVINGLLIGSTFPLLIGLLSVIAALAMGNQYLFRFRITAD